MTIYEAVTGELMWEGVGGCAQLNGARFPDRLYRLPKDLSMLIEACLSLNTWDRPSAKQIAKYCQTRNPELIKSMYKPVERNSNNAESAPTKPQHVSYTMQQKPDVHDANQQIKQNVPEPEVRQQRNGAYLRYNLETVKRKLHPYTARLLKRLPNQKVAILIAAIMVFVLLSLKSLSVIITDMREYKAYENCKTYEDFEQFIQKYPESNKINAARNQMRLLKPRDFHRSETIEGDEKNE